MTFEIDELAFPAEEAETTLNGSGSNRQTRTAKNSDGVANTHEQPQTATSSNVQSPQGSCMEECRLCDAHSSYHLLANLVGTN